MRHVLSSLSMRRRTGVRGSGLVRRLVVAPAMAAIAIVSVGWAWPVQVCAADDVPLVRTIQAPHYGDVVFHFFQDDDFTAITTLMASQHFRRLGPHDDEAELLRGGMLLSWGVHGEAGEIFARLIDRVGTPDAVRDRAWLYLAKARYQRGQIAAAQEALNRVQHELPEPLQEEQGLLRAQLLMAQGDHAGAAQLLKAMSARTPEAGYVRFNLGVAQMKAGQTIEGTGTLDALGLEPAYDDEQLALRDRANVALGFAAMRAHQPAAARRYLERVSMDGPESNKALLAYGWAALDLRAPQYALVPWLKLNARNANDAAALESRIAVPYAYAQLGAKGRALQHYAMAIRSFTTEQQDLDAAVADIQSGRLVQELLAFNPRGELGEGWHMDEWPDVPHAAQLTRLFARNDFQEAFKNLRDLHQLERHLQTWRDNIDKFQDMLDTRRQAFAQRRAQVDTSLNAAHLQAVRQRVDALAAEVDQAQDADDGLALADARQRELLDRVARAQAILAQGAGDASPELAQARERLRLVSGVLNWQLAQDLPDRLWAAQKGLQDMRAGLAQAEQRQASLAQAMDDEPRRLDGFQGRIQAMASQIDAMLPRVTALAAEQQAVVQDLAAAELVQQKEVLATYLVQARFAVAQLYDRSADDDSPLPRAILGRNQGLGDAPAEGSNASGEVAHAPKP